MSTAVLGIDVSKATLDCHIMYEEESKHLKIENNRKGFRSLAKWMKNQGINQVRAAMEATGTFFEGIAEFLYEAGHEVSVVNPARIKKYSESLGLRNKTDKLDAWVIAKYCRSEDLRLWSPPAPSTRDLRTLTRYLGALKGMRQQQRNRLSSGANNAYTRRSINKTIRMMDKEIKGLEEQIKSHIEQHPDLKHLRDLLETIPGIGHLTACKLISEIQDISIYDHPKQLAAHAGVTPQRSESGTSSKGGSPMSKKGNVHIRNALFFSAVSARRHNPIVRAAAERHIARGNCKMSAVGVAMRQLLHTVWGVWSSGQPFDPEFPQKKPIRA